uniref:Uncharacterized protein n=1 Tax=Sphaerodactylus townsendi TaxID=933632 RepID=A0ACB8G9V9_9SAUR
MESWLPIESVGSILFHWTTTAIAFGHVYLVQENMSTDCLPRGSIFSFGTHKHFQYCGDCTCPHKYLNRSLKLLMETRIFQPNCIQHPPTPTPRNITFIILTGKAT